MSYLKRWIKEAREEKPSCIFLQNIISLPVFSAAPAGVS